MIVCRNKQRGYLLVTVVVMLFLIASIAVLLAHDSSISANTVSGELEATRADYVAEAGMQHALWKSGNNACIGNSSIPTTAFGSDSYTATVSGAAGGILHTLSADQDAWIRSDDISRNNGTSIWNHMRFQAGKIERVLTRFDLSALPANAEVRSAVAWFHLKAGKNHPQGPITIHEVTSDWSETTVTWESFADRFRPERLGMIVAQANGDVWVAVNLTGQVQAWVNGQPNFGILFDTQGEGIHTEYAAREGSNPPRLEVVVGSGSASPVAIVADGVLANGVARSLAKSPVRTYQIPSAFQVASGIRGGQDTFIRQNQEYGNFGGDAELWVRDASGGNGDSSLLRFDLQSLPSGARVLNATLSLYQFYAATPGGTIAVHRLTRDWQEGSNSGSNGNSSWKTYGLFRWWSDSGGDFDPVSVAETLVPSGSVGWHTWNIRDLANNWANGKFPNNGLILTSASPGTDTGFTSSDDSDTTRHPLLTVSYACECGSVCLAPQGSGKLLMVVANSIWNPSAEEKSIRAFLEQWGYTVSLIRDSDDQASYDSKIAANDFVFVPATVDSSDVDTKLTSTSVGVVIAQRELTDELGVSTSAAAPVLDTIDIVDNSHYITAMFSNTTVPFKTVGTELTAVSGTVAPGAQELAQVGGAGSLVLLEAGAASSSGGSVAGRRVLVPVGAGNASWNYLTNAGQLLLQRALQWSSGDTGPVVSLPIFLSTGGAATLGGLSFDDIDVVEYDSGADTATLFFEGALTTLNSDIDAIHVLENGHFILSTKGDDTLGGLSFTAGDLVDYDPATDMATRFFEETAFAASTDIISVFVTGDGNIVFSTDGDATLGGLDFTDNDLVEYDPGSGTATLYFDGSTTTLSSDIDALHVLDNGHIILSTKNSDSLGGLNFDDGDLVDYNPVNDTAVLYFDEALFAADEDLISVHIGPGSGPVKVVKKIYWTDDNAAHIQRSDEDGSNVETVVSGQATVRGIDIDSVNGKIYWTSNVAIRRANLDGSNMESVFVGSSVNLDIKLDVAAGKMYWSHDNGDDRIMRANLDGSNSEVINNSLGDPAYLSLDTASGSLYTTEFDSGNVSRMNLDGSSHTTLIIGPDGAVGNALDAVGGKIYWSGGASNDWIKRANLDGSNEETIVTGLNAPQDIHYDSDNDRIYWTDALVIPSIKRANGDGSNVETLVTGLNRPRGIVLVDASLVPPVSEGGPVFETQIASGDDDAEQIIATGWVDLISSDVELVFDVGSNPTDLVGLRFTGVSIPQGATIANAYVQFQVDEASSNVAVIGVRGENIDDAAPFTTAAFDISSRSPTATSVKWVPPAWNIVGVSGIDQRTPNIASVVQEIVSRPGWSGGNAMVILLSGSGTRTAESYQGDPSAAPLLHIEIAGNGDQNGQDGAGGGGCVGSYRDQFDARTWDGSSGTIDWGTSWEQIGETDGPTSGDIQIRNDESNYQLRTRDNDNGGEGVERDVDLGGAGSAKLRYEFRRQSLDKSSDYTSVEISADGAAGPWAELARHEGPNNDDTYIASSHDISAWATSNTRIRFTTSSSMGGTDTVWFDNIELECGP